MKVALGLKAHSGWAVGVVLGVHGDALALVDRRRIALMEEADADWAKQPYHAAEGLDPDEASAIVKRGIASAHAHAERALREAVARVREAKHELAACAVLSSAPMPDWSVAEILAVHFRMHKAEGVLFRDALARAAERCALPLVQIVEKELPEVAARALALPRARIAKSIAALGAAVGAPWGKDQKDAALAAWIGLRARTAEPGR